MTTLQHARVPLGEVAERNSETEKLLDAAGALQRHLQVRPSSRQVGHVTFARQSCDPVLVLCEPGGPAEPEFCTGVGSQADGGRSDVAGGCRQSERPTDQPQRGETPRPPGDLQPAAAVTDALPLPVQQVELLASQLDQLRPALRKHVEVLLIGLKTNSALESVHRAEGHAHQLQSHAHSLHR